MGNNRIGIISLDFITDRKSDAWQLQQQLKHLIKHSILPKLDGLFQQIDDGASLIRLDTLDINIGRFSRSQLEQEFIKRVVEQIEQELKKIVKDNSLEEGRQVFSVQRGMIMAFVHFLKSGTIPKGFRSVFAEADEQVILDTIQSQSEILKMLFALFEKNTLAKARLIDQFTAYFVKALLDSIDGKEFQKKILPPKAEEDKDVGPVKDTSAEKEDFKALNLERTALVESSKERKNSSLDIAGEGLSGEEFTNNNFVHNAGLILLHPYLSGDNEEGFCLFRETGLIKEGAFIDEVARERALHLLQYLVWLEEQRPEHEMMLDKILCGFPEDQSVNRFIELTIAEKQACEEMIKIIAEEWKGMSDLSLAALQESFLQRLGKLEASSLGWKLQVEKKTIDILLKRLPYGLGIIKFPWMNKMLWVEWDY